MEMYVIVDNVYGCYWDSDDEEWIDNVITEGCVFYTVGKAEAEIKDRGFTSAKVKKITLEDVD